MSLITKERLAALGLESLDKDHFRPLDAPLMKSGILVVDKPAGISSMDVVRLVRRLCRPKKIGHGGSLDPLATGVLPLLLNSATKWSNEVMAGEKEYEGFFLLGLTSETQDVDGLKGGEEPKLPIDLSLDKIQAQAKAREGWIEQMPPMYSAVKKNGKALYEYARQGESVEVEPRKVFVKEFEITSWDGQSRVGFRARVSKGVYVRTLVHDLGQSLGCGAVLETLVRTQVGPFHWDEALQLSTLKYAADVEEHLKPVTLVMGQVARASSEGEKSSHDL